MQVASGTRPNATSPFLEHVIFKVLAMIVMTMMIIVKTFKITCSRNGDEGMQRNGDIGDGRPSDMSSACHKVDGV